MALLLIACPELIHTDLELIQGYRKAHDKLYKIVDPHFTFVFPVHGISIADFSAEIKKQLLGENSIMFCLKSAIANKDAFSETYNAFLVPDEGYSQIVKLHDKLYSGALSAHHRTDIEYIPHITIGSSHDSAACQKLADEWNTNYFAICGSISSFEIADYENGVITSVEKIQLRK